jgi:type I restriction enzyme R subunit
MKQQDIKLNPDTSHYINHLLVAEYLNEFNSGARAW